VEKKVVLAKASKTEEKKGMWQGEKRLNAIFFLSAAVATPAALRIETANFTY
jgi:hypothetical protein